ncbi:hypothetical protein [Fodinicola acaciae]|uniref:hypothetical protein n=1 Tax=Fodinicola acaciae TaxID=2681555 RepID=UPI0013D7EFF1|nr:hypothetical protein [Fodinicola acaciae]
MQHVYGTIQPETLYGVNVDGHALGAIQLAGRKRDWAVEYGGRWHPARDRGRMPNPRSVLEGLPYVLHYDNYLDLGDGRWLGITRRLTQRRVDFYEVDRERVVGWMARKTRPFSMPDIEAYLPDYLPPPAILLLVLGELKVIRAQQQALLSSS